MKMMMMTIEIIKGRTEGYDDLNFRCRKGADLKTKRLGQFGKAYNQFFGGSEHQKLNHLSVVCKSLEK